jgi:hypothetical protein
MAVTQGPAGLCGAPLAPRRHSPSRVCQWRESPLCGVRLLSPVEMPRQTCAARALSGAMRLDPRAPGPGSEGSSQGLSVLRVTSMADVRHGAELRLPDSGRALALAGVGNPRQ